MFIIEIRFSEPLIKINNMNKILVFEYLVYRLDKWKKDIEKTGKIVPSFTKLRLQKILFLVCAWNTSDTDMRLLNTFNNFYALPYGPVEMDIYEAMKKSNSFQYIKFQRNECVYDKLDESMFNDIQANERRWVDEAVEKFETNQRKYLTMPVFDLVELTHKWSVWQIAMQYAKLLEHNKARITSSDIIESKKSYD